MRGGFLSLSFQQARPTTKEFDTDARPHSPPPRQQYVGAYRLLNHVAAWIYAPSFGAALPSRRRKTRASEMFASTDKMSSPGYAPPQMLLDSSRATTPQLLLDSSRATTPVARWSYKLTCCLVTAVACQETSRLFHTPRLGVLLEGLSPPTWTLSTLRVPATYCDMLGVYDLIWLRL